MRKKVLGFVSKTGRKAVAGAASAQGVAGVAAISGGCWVQFGEGWALITGGGFLLLGAANGASLNRGSR